MPYKKKYNKRKKPAKKAYKKRATISRSLPLICPDRQFVKLVEASSGRFTASAAALKQVYSGNSIFDPDVTGVGGQPTGTDQWFGFYEHVKVRGCKIELRMLNQTATVGAVDPIEVSLSANRDQTAVTFIEQTYAKNKVMGDLGKSTYLSMYMSAKKVMGRSQLNEKDFRHNSSTNPAERWYYIIDWANLNGNLTIDILMTAKITYYCEFFERKNLSDS